MSDELVVRRMLRELKGDDLPSGSLAAEKEREARHVARMDEWLRRRQRRSVRPLWAFAAAAAGLAVVFEVLRSFGSPQEVAPTAAPSAAVAAKVSSTEVTPLSGNVRLETNGGARERTIAATEPLRRGDRVHVGTDAQALVRLASGARIDLGASTDLRLEGDDNDAVRLTRGRVELSVPPLRPRSLAVVTPDARVTVVGTRFSVTVEAAGAAEASRTCVNVSEGRVLVASATASRTLDPGEAWSSDARPCASLAKPAAAPSSSALPPRPRALPPPPVALEPPEEVPLEAPLPPAPASQLAEQNRLFAAALRARERGDSAQARALLVEFLERFPETALAPQARRELERLEEP